MTTLNQGISHTLRAAPRALVLLSLMALPLMAVESVRAGDENIIEGSQQMSSGAGLVLVVSLQRAQ